MFEMLTFGEHPYANIDPNESVIEFVRSGRRLAKPDAASNDQ
jgi:Protein tyrosine and serine/threonine kinase